MLWTRVDSPEQQAASIIKEASFTWASRDRDGGAWENLGV